MTTHTRSARLAAPAALLLLAPLLWGGAAGAAKEEGKGTAPADGKEKDKGKDEKKGDKQKDRFFEFFAGAGGGYEYFKLTSISAQKMLNDSVQCSVAATEVTACIKPDEIKGNGGLWRVFGGIRLGMMGIGVDYRQSYIEGPINWGQLMADFWIIFPVPIVKPFLKIGIGWIHLKVKDVTVKLAGTESKRDGDLISGLGLRGGVGLLIKPVRFFSIGVTAEVAGTYFKEGNEGTWGYAVDITGHLAFHVP